MASCADDTALMGIEKGLIMSTDEVQSALSRILGWTNQRKINLNGLKCLPVNFTYKKVDLLSLYLNGTTVLYEYNVNYLGINLDANL